MRCNMLRERTRDKNGTYKRNLFEKESDYRSGPAEVGFAGGATIVCTSVQTLPSQLLVAYLH